VIAFCNSNSDHDPATQHRQDEEERSRLELDACQLNCSGPLPTGRQLPGDCPLGCRDVTTLRFANTTMKIGLYDSEVIRRCGRQPDLTSTRPD